MSGLILLVCPHSHVYLAINLGNIARLCMIYSFPSRICQKDISSDEYRHDRHVMCRAAAGMNGLRVTWRRIFAVHPENRTRLEIKCWCYTTEY